MILVIGEASAHANNLRECSERSTYATTDQEYDARLTASQRGLIDRILIALSGHGCDNSCVRRLLSCIDVDIVPDASIERDHAPLWMPEASATPERLLGLLRDMIGGASRIRGSFNPTALRTRLKDEHSIDICEPDQWGSAHYRSVLSGKAVIQIPGTAFAKSISELFLWPRATRYDRTHRSDFDDETPRPAFGVLSDTVDLSLFPSQGLDRLVVIAGPGFGKSVLSLALAESAIRRGFLPAIVSIPELSRRDIEIVDFLKERVNKTYEVEIDWGAASNSGLLILLLDGLDEVSSDRRAVILERIKTFSLRHPGTPWLLTVRDAAALSAPTDALLVELHPLNRNDIGRFVALYRPMDTDLPERLAERLRASPDLERLVRIPLFLAILLASSSDLNELPANRKELLENYLELLFRPEQFKAVEADGVDPSTLRTIAEVTAFDALEREEIGVSVRLLTTTIRQQQAPGAPLQPVMERLVKCGVLSRVSPSSFSFPFPIIQEYLAACHILEHRLDEVPERLSSTMRRPWAQALQFVLERHPAPNRIIDELLARDDDAFFTDLRLVTRCVTNSMSVGPVTKEEISRRLGRAWPNSTWGVKLRIGDLIRDSFYDPLVSEFRDQLSNRWLLHQGAGAVVARINDTTLTSKVLAELLAGDVEYLLNLGELQNPVSALGDQALKLYADRARSPHASENDKHAMASLISQLDGTQISEPVRLSVSLDENLPLSVRLSAFSIGPAPIDNRALPLIASAICMKGYQPKASAIEVLDIFPPIPRRLPHSSAYRKPSGPRGQRDADRRPA